MGFDGGVMRCASSNMAQSQVEKKDVCDHGDGQQG